MAQRFLAWVYGKLGSRYPALILTVELQSAFVIALGTVALLTRYYEGPQGDFLILVAVVMALTAITVAIGLLRMYPTLRPLQRWIAGQRDPEQTGAAWSTAIGLPLNLIRRDLFLPVVGVAVPGTFATVVILDLQWTAFIPIFIGGLISIGYSGILHYFAIEAAMRPVLMDINRALPPRSRADHPALPLRWKLLAALPLINVITGMVVAALTTEGGQVGLGINVLIAMAVAFAISLDLSILLTKSIVRPLGDLQRAIEAVREGRYDQQVPITTGDEIGEVSAAFNQMVDGLAERERIREAFGTYLDKDIAEHILSDNFDPAGNEVEVTLLFCDVRDYTGFAERAEPTEVVTSLNALFERVVPIIARHGGHVDKFVGDGLLAVFGAPESFSDHADRAVAAAVEMAKEMNRSEEPGLQVGIGVNTGRVIAGSIGGAGRLNFSVIGDPVNVASRVEAKTRETGDDVLITAETRDRLSTAIELEPRGSQVLKGKDEPVELYAPTVTLPQAHVAHGDGVAETIG